MPANVRHVGIMRFSDKGMTKKKSFYVKWMRQSLIGKLPLKKDFRLLSLQCFTYCRWSMGSVSLLIVHGRRFDDGAVGQLVTCIRTGSTILFLGQWQT